MTVFDERRAEIALSGMRFHVCVGILPHEREFPEPLEIDLRVRCVRDRKTVLDYRTLYAVVSAVLDTGPLDYLEEIAEAVLSRALSLESVSWARATIRKPHVLLPGPLAHAEIVVEGSNA